MFFGNTPSQIACQILFMVNIAQACGVAEAWKWKFCYCHVPIVPTNCFSPMTDKCHVCNQTWKKSKWLWSQNIDVLEKLKVDESGEKNPRFRNWTKNSKLMKVSRKQSTPLSFGEFSKERSTSSSVCPIFLFPKSQNNASMGNFKSFQVTSGRSFDQVWKKNFCPLWFKRRLTPSSASNWTKYSIKTHPHRSAAGAMFARDKPPKKCTGLANVAGFRIARTHFRSDTAATLARLGCSLGQQGHNFSPTWAQLAPTSAQLGCKIAQLGPTWSHSGYGFKLGDIASLIHSHSPQNAQFRWSKKVFKSNFRQYARMEKQT